jgi:hypothetical protein
VKSCSPIHDTQHGNRTTEQISEALISVLIQIGQVVKALAGLIIKLRT